VHFYRSFHSGADDRPHFDSTLDDARATIQSFVPSDRALVRVELVDIPVDKESIRQMLCDNHMLGVVQRTWCGTARGGLKEIANGE
jgi:hypothetical protein